jgi:hypothetical protein
MIFRTGSDRGAVAFTSQANRTKVRLKANRHHLGHGPTAWSAPEFDGLYSHHPKRSAPATSFVLSEPNKAGVNTPYTLFLPNVNHLYLFVCGAAVRCGG